MARKLASLATVASCTPLENSDRLSVTTMVENGWKVVTSRDEFKPGDRVVYFEIDSYLPADDDRYAFLRERCLKKFMSKSGKLLKEGLRIKTVKLRGQLSQGLILAAAALDEVPVDTPTGTDLTELLHVAHYDEMVAVYAPPPAAVSGDAMGPFPSRICKTDEERIQNLSDYFTRFPGRLFEVTEKNDGSSCTMFWSPSIDAENPFGVCSRNLRLKPSSDNGTVSAFWKVANEIDAESRVHRACRILGRELAFQGELVGPGVNGNRDLYDKYEWHVFKVWDIDAQEYLLPEEARTVCEAVDLEYVPVVAEALDVFATYDTMDKLLAYADGTTSRGNKREGLVFKSVEKPYVTFKAVSNDYLLSIK